MTRSATRKEAGGSALRIVVGLLVAAGAPRLGCGSLLVAIALAACDGTPAPASLTADGTPLVESDRPLWAPGDAWRVDPEPLLRIGSVDGPAELSFVRVTSAHLLAGGGLAVVDGGAPQVRFFSGEGRFLRSLGGEGDGPGEFRGPLTAALAGDGLWIHDAGLNRLTVVDTRSEAYRVVRHEATNARHGLAGVLPNGTAVLVADLMFDFTPDDSLPAGPQRFGAAYLRVSPTGETLDTILVAPGAERVLRYGEQTMEMLRPLFARGPSHAVTGGRVHQGSQDVYVVRVFDAAGAPPASADPTVAPILEMRRDDVDPTLTESDYARAVEGRVAAVPEPRRAALRAMYDGQPVPETRPAYAAFLGDALGHLWVQDFSVEGPARTWAVFAPDGAWLGTVVFPESFRPTHIVGNRVAGVFVDPLGVEYVQVHRLTRGR